MTPERLIGLLTASGRPEVLVIGDIILDKFIWGHVDRISPEAPVQVVNISRENMALGGAANVANNLVAIGCKTTLAGVIGRDDAGKTLRTELRRAGIKDAMLLDNSRPTTTKTRILAGSQHVVRIDNEQTSPISRTAEKSLVGFIRKNVSRFKVVVISDYNKGVLTDHLLSEIIRMCNKAGIRSIVDPKRKDFRVYSGASLIKPNAKEATVASGMSLNEKSTVQEVASAMQKEFKIDNILITLGKEGMYLLQKNGSSFIQSVAREVFDVTGAGDTVVAYLARHMALGHELEDAASIANMAAGVSVSRMGTVTVKIEDILSQVHAETCDRKIISLSELLKIFPKRGKKLVFTNGCFDILHVGHITLLGKAKSLGDALVVGVNTDASIRKLKGQNRPIVSERERAHILAALQAVDYVVLFDEDTPIKIIKALKPDILVKGSDYTVDQVVGGSFVESYGGKVALVDLVAGFSTTNIVETILKSYASEVKSRPKAR